MPRYRFDDEDVVVIVGSGAGGGTLANELCQKGVKVVVLEAGRHHTPDDFVNDEWRSFKQLAWLDNRTTSGSFRVAKDFPNLPAWTCKTVGGTTTHWAAAARASWSTSSRPRATTKGSRRQRARLADLARRRRAATDRAETKMGITSTNGIPGSRPTTTTRCSPTAPRVGYKRFHTGREQCPTTAARPRSRTASTSRA